MTRPFIVVTMVAEKERAMKFQLAAVAAAPVGAAGAVGGPLHAEDEAGDAAWRAAMLTADSDDEKRPERGAANEYRSADEMAMANAAATPNRTKARIFITASLANRTDSPFQL
jgi:hypothetical protein